MSQSTRQQIGSESLTSCRRVNWWTATPNPPRWKITRAPLFLRPAYAVLAPTHPAIVCSVVVDHYKTSPLDVVSGVLHDTGVPHLAADISFKRVQEGMDDWEAVIWYKGTPHASMFAAPSAPIEREVFGLANTV
ncbi:hypothetical protein DFH06DRAFT_1150053 [Mycena polygramma]|nr:hypothetical protein DFH06DRAFT_1150053 [Mycena polygramma]